MSFSESQLTALREAVARGVLEAQLSDGSRVRYRSQADMLALIAKIEHELGTVSDRVNVVYPSHKRGFSD